jgi:serine/threonine protein kinase
MGEPYDMAVDIWSIGVITYVLLCGFPPFYGDVQKELFDNIMSGNYDFPDPEWTDVSEEAKDFIKKILVVNPAKRMTAEEALKHPWITAGAKKSLKRLETFNVHKFKEYTQVFIFLQLICFLFFLSLCLLFLLIFFS